MLFFIRWNFFRSNFIFNFLDIGVVIMLYFVNLVVGGDLKKDFFFLRKWLSFFFFGVIM